MRQKGSAPFLLILAIAGIVGLLAVGYYLPINKKSLGGFFTKPFSFAAATDTITIGEPLLHPTFNSIDIELPFNDGNIESLKEVKVSFKKSSDNTWREGLPLWPTRPVSTDVAIYQPPQPTAFGSVLQAESGTSYDIHLTAIGSSGTTLEKIASVTTRVENIPDASSLVPTHFVNPVTGNDSSGTPTNKATPWKTLRKAIQTAPAGAIIELAPGYYVEPTINSAPINKKLTIKAEFPAVDNSLNIINEGKHSVIQDGSQTGNGAATIQKPFTSGPTGSGAPYENVWVQDATLSATAGKPIWKWAGSSHAIGLNTVYQMGFHQTRESLPVRIMHWDRLTDSNGSANTMTPSAWASTIGSNKTYRYGFYQDSAAPYDIYLAPPPNMVDTSGATTDDPNKTWITAGAGYGLLIRAADVRISGVQIRNLENCLTIGGTSVDSSPFNNSIIDHNIFSGCLAGIRLDSNASPNNGHGLGSKDAVIQYNLFHDRTLWTDDHSTDPGSPWVFTKEKITRVDGTLSAGNRFGGKNESVGITYKNEGAKWTVVRNNKFDGPQNGMSANGGVPNTPRDSTRGTDFYQNECVRIVDDCIEPENASINWKIWDNKIHKTTVILSAAPIHWGPLYFFRNQAWDIGAVGGGVEHSSGRTRLSTAVLMKGGALNTAKKHVRPLLYFVNNSYWTNIAGGGIPNNSDYGSGGIDDTINGQGNYNMVKYVRNNIFRTTRYTSRVGQGDYATNWDEDFNAMVSKNSPEQSPNQNYIGMRIEGGINGHQIYSSYSPSTRQVSSTSGFTIEDYRNDLKTTPNRPSNYGNGLHSNKLGNGGSDISFASPVDGSGAVAVLDALLTNPLAGELALKTGISNGLIDGGTIVANIADCFTGTSPDIGALESAGTTTCSQSVTNEPASSSPPSTSHSPATSLPGDIDGNGKVDIFDYNLLLTDFGKTGTLATDIDKNGKVDIFDYNTVLTHFGS
ncbi:MAG: DUF1565 domain-containing protein [Saprospiraceae bacterium]|nr:DUF1565 domain-containing protein [Saprospiraceae bacterium]